MLATTVRMMSLPRAAYADLYSIQYSQSHDLDELVKFEDVGTMLTISTLRPVHCGLPLAHRLLSSTELLYP